MRGFEAGLGSGYGCASLSLPDRWMVAAPVGRLPVVCLDGRCLSCLQMEDSGCLKARIAADAISRAVQIVR